MKLGPLINSTSTNLAPTNLNLNNEYILLNSFISEKAYLNKIEILASQTGLITLKVKVNNLNLLNINYQNYKKSRFSNSIFVIQNTHVTII